MLMAQPAPRLARAALLGTLILAAAPVAVRAGAAALPSLESLSAPVRVRATLREPGDGAALADPCYPGAQQCFDPLVDPRTYLNVGSFFDSQQATSNTHYFLKLYRNDGGESVRLLGMGFESRSRIRGRSSPETNRFAAAGAVVLGPELVFPKPEALLSLPEVGIVGHNPDTMTCVEFTLGIDPKGRPLQPEIVLAPGDAAWLVLRFASYPDSVFLGVRVDPDANDQPCDFMTADGGEYWYRPDPVNGPVYDWGITAYVEPRQSSPEPPPPTWTLVKLKYR